MSEQTDEQDEAAEETGAPATSRLGEVENEIARLDAQAEAPAPVPIATDDYDAAMHGLPTVAASKEAHESHAARVQEARVKRSELQEERSRLVRATFESDEYKRAIAAAESPSEVLDVQRRFGVGKGYGQMPSAR